MNDEDRNEIGPDGFARRATDDQDVEGHRAQRAAGGDEMDAEGFARRGASEGDEDTEGHAARRATEGEEDVEGHGLLLDTDFYINRKMGRDADLEREARDRRNAKEARPNKTDRG